MIFSIEIKCDNDAFDGVDFAYEIQRILEETGRKIEALHPAKPVATPPPNTVIAPVEVGVLVDVTGNMVGTWSLDYNGGTPA